MMRMAVCMKQIPQDIGKNISADGCIQRNDTAMINPADVFALETALMLKERHGGTVDIFTMGTKAAESLLRETAALGADGLFLLSDPDFAGADTYATAFVLAAALQQIAAYDFILCGRKTQDGETGQVPIQLAAFLGIPIVTNVLELRDGGNAAITCRRQLRDGEEWVEVKLPALLSVMEGMEGIGHPRLPSVFGVQRAAGCQIMLLHREQLALAKTEVGRLGSFTEVKRTYMPAWQRSCVFLNAEQGANWVRTMLKKIVLETSRGEWDERK